MSATLRRFLLLAYLAFALAALHLAATGWGFVQAGERVVALLLALLALGFAFQLWREKAA